MQDLLLLFFSLCVRLCLPQPKNERKKRNRQKPLRCYHFIILHLLPIKGSSMRPLSSQHGGLYSRQRIQLEELADDSSIRSPYIGIIAVRSQSQESKTNGAPDKEPAGAEAVHLSCRRRISRVSHNPVGSLSGLLPASDPFPSLLLHNKCLDLISDLLPFLIPFSVL